ncbi:MAG: tetratricopeptide repeat protein [[Clostridium] fimetarium]|nr:tetratricopeptide repeat protein [Alistipes timonensis]MCM1404871.1 tetratricopeptide repeat protein [[Clostridium] fimetarium]
MKIRSFLAAAILASASALPAAAQGLDNPMTRAMMEVYNQEIAANPQSYDVYFRRANEYYKFNQYLRALSDVDNAIKYAPAADTDFLFEARFLRAEIYQMLDKHEEALADFTEALKLDPSSFLALYQKANSEYELGRYADAKADYNRMRAINPRSAEALTGLARVSVKENNLGLAQQYMDDAVSMMPTDSDIFVRRSSVRRMLGDNTGAVEDLIMAISIDSNSRAIQELAAIGNADYPAVITGLSSAVSKAPDQPMLYYLRGFIAQAHAHYLSAIDDYRKLVDNNMYNYAGIYGALGECYFQLCDFDRALEYTNQAIGMDPANPEFNTTLSRIRRAKGDFAPALKAVDFALSDAPTNRAALTEKGLALFSLGRFDEASGIFGELIMDNPEDAMSYMLQAWVVNDGLKQPRNATPIYKRLLDALPAESVNAAGEHLTAPSTLRGFAMLFAGDSEGALRWADDLLRDNNDTDGSVNYLAACLYAQAGAADKALACVDRSLGKGYASLYNWKHNDAGRVNVAPLRDDPRFARALESYSYLFK